MKTFSKYLEENVESAELRSVLESLKDGIIQIAGIIDQADTGKAGSENVYGEDQMALDVLANRLLIDECKKNEVIGLIASEELAEEIRVSDGEFAVCFDPLDGSSLIDVNLSLGTIIGVYKTGSFIGVKGRDQLAAFAVTYGPRVTLMFSIGKGTCEFTLEKSGKFVVSKANLKVSEGKMFAPGNLRATSERKDYLRLVNFWIENEYKLRYSGGMVPDVAQILIKGKGIFSYPGYSQMPKGKLRLLVECAPIAMLVENAGGASSDGKISILDKSVDDIAARSPIFVGSKAEVERCEQFLN